MFANVLIVCHANVCRSPAAEMLFTANQRSATGASRAVRTPIKFHSAGIRALDGHGMDRVMQRLLAERGVTADIHYSRRLTPRIVREADLILVAERRQVREVEALEPTSRGKVYPLGKWEGADVSDPHGGTEAEYRESLGLIERLVRGWLERIC